MADGAACEDIWYKQTAISDQVKPRKLRLNRREARQMRYYVIKAISAHNDRAKLGSLQPRGSLRIIAVSMTGRSFDRKVCYKDRNPPRVDDLVPAGQKPRPLAIVVRPDVCCRARHLFDRFRT